MFTSIVYSQKCQSEAQLLIPENLKEMYKNDKHKNVLESMFSEIDGTYQVQCLNTNYKILLSQALYEKIKLFRKDDEDVYLELDNLSRLFLPSTKKIKESNFGKLINSIYLSY